MKYKPTILALIALALGAAAAAVMLPSTQAAGLGMTTVHQFTLPLEGTASQVTIGYPNYTAYDITYHTINGQAKVEDFRRLHIALSGTGDKLGLTIPMTSSGGSGGGGKNLEGGTEEKVGIQYDFVNPDAYPFPKVTSVFVVNHRVNGVITLMIDSKDNYNWKVISKETYPAPGASPLPGSAITAPTSFWKPEWMKSDG